MTTINIHLYHIRYYKQSDNQSTQKDIHNFHTKYYHHFISETEAILYLVPHVGILEPIFHGYSGMTVYKILILGVICQDNPGRSSFLRTEFVTV